MDQPGRPVHGGGVLRIHEHHAPRQEAGTRFEQAAGVTELALQLHSQLVAVEPDALAGCIQRRRQAVGSLDRRRGHPCAPRRSYQPLLELTTRTTSSITGTSISTPTTVASAAPESKPNRLIAAATASSKKLDAPISAEGQATSCFSPIARLSR